MKNKVTGELVWKSEKEQIKEVENIKKIEDVYKFNVIQLAKHHRKFCEGEDCNISLILLMEMAEKLDIVFSDKEKELFL